MSLFRNSGRPFFSPWLLNMILLFFDNEVYRWMSLRGNWSEEYQCWSYGVMVSTLDSESNNPSSNLGRTFFVPQLLLTSFRTLSNDLYHTCHSLFIFVLPLRNVSNYDRFFPWNNILFHYIPFDGSSPPKRTDKDKNLRMLH